MTISFLLSCCSKANHSVVDWVKAFLHTIVTSDQKDFRYPAEDKIDKLFSLNHENFPETSIAKL